MIILWERHSGAGAAGQGVSRVLRLGQDVAIRGSRARRLVNTCCIDGGDSGAAIAPVSQDRQLGHSKHVHIGTQAACLNGSGPNQVVILPPGKVEIDDRLITGQIRWLRARMTGRDDARRH